jgi:hypothetical protein
MNSLRTHSYSFTHEENYIDNLQEINKNLRDQLELLYKLIKIKIKVELANMNQSYKLENIINELEILKTSLSFSMQNQNGIVSKI